MSGPDALRVFCSYRSSDAGAVEDFAARLRARGVDAWFDRWEIKVGDDIVARMDSGVDGCDAALIFISEAWFDGRWAYDEYTSLALRKVEDGIRVIPVKIGEVQVTRLPARLRKLARRSVDDFDAICDTLEGVDRKPGLGTVLRAEAVAVAVTVSRDMGGQIVATLSIPGTGDVSGRAAVGLAGVALDGVRSAQALDEVGRRVGQAVFAGEVGRALGVLLDGLQAGCAVDLRVQADAELMAVAFEAARLPDGQVVVLHGAVRMSRCQLPGPGSGLGVVPTAGPLKILVAVGAPDEGQTRNVALAIEAEMGLILDGVAGAVQDDRAQVRILEVASLHAIEQALARDAYHVLHLSGHGGGDIIELEDEDGHAVCVTADQLVEVFAAADTVMPLVFVAACRSGDSASGLALGLHRRGVARVIAMSGPVTDTYSTRLAAEFYGQLSRAPWPRAGVALAAARRAVERARQREETKGGWPEWATATLLLAGDDAPLLDSDLPGRELRAAPVYTVGGCVPMLGMGELIGRRGQLRETLRALRHDPRFTAVHGEIAGVLLTGIGGVGKSSIAGRVMARLSDDGWTVSATTGVWSLERVCAQLADDLTPAEDPVPSTAPWARQLHARLTAPGLDDARRLELLSGALRDHRVLIVWDNFEDNLTADARVFADELSGVVVRQLLDGCVAGRILVTSRYPLPGCADALHEVTVGALSHAETRRMLLRLHGLRQLSGDDALLVRSLIGGHPRALELLDALLRHGTGVQRIRVKLRDLAEREQIRPADARDLAGAIDETVRLAARDIVLDALLDELDDLERELLLAVAVSALPVEHQDLPALLGSDSAATLEELAAAAARLNGLSLLARTDQGLWMHRWTAQALRTRQPADDHRARCHRAGLMRRSRLRQTTRDVTEGIEATQNFLDAGSMDNAAQIALEVCAFLKQNSTLDLASFARHARQALPTSHDTYKLFADDEAQALMALGATSQAVERYVELVRDHEALAASDPGRADYQRDVSVSYEKLGDLQQALGDGDQALKLFTASLEIAQRLAAAEPGRADYQRDVSVSYERLGDLQRALGDGDQALKLFTASLEIRERLAAAEPGRADYQRDVSVSYNKLGDMLAQAGDRAQAERYYRDSLTIAERLAPADPFTQALRGKLEGLGNDGEATPPD